jgi:hypothetical protein
MSDTKIAPAADAPALPPQWEFVQLKDIGDIQLGRQRASHAQTKEEKIDGQSASYKRYLM